MAIVKYRFEQGTVLGTIGSNANGVCLELTRRWVKAQLAGQWVAGDTIYNWTDTSTGEMDEVLENQKKRGTLGDTAIDDLNHTSSARRTGGGCFSKFHGLRTRMDVIDHVLSVPGVYIYAATSRNGGGHAFSFDTRVANHLAFFDPNQGEFIFNNESGASVREWWRRFWDASGGAVEDGNRNYKTAFHKGVRELFKYNIA